MRVTYPKIKKLVVLFFFVTLFAVTVLACGGDAVTNVDGDVADSENSDGDVTIDNCKYDNNCEDGEVCCLDQCVLPEDCNCSESQNNECVWDWQCSGTAYCQNDCSCGEAPDGDPDGEESDDVVDPTCNCEKDPCITFTPAGGLNFGCVPLGDTSVRSLHIRNDGGETLNIFSIDFSANTSSDYQWATEDGLPPTYGGNVIALAPGDEVSYGIKLLPTGPGRDIGVIDIISNDKCKNGGQHAITMKSEYKGSTKLDVSPAGNYFDYGPIEANSGGADMKVTLTNNAQFDENGCGKLLAIGPMQWEPSAQGDFVLPSTINPTKVIYLVPGESLSFLVKFNPLTAGMKTAKLVIHHDADEFEPDQKPVEITLTGNGVIPCLTIIPDPIDFGDVTVGVQASLLITLSSTCGGTVKMDGIEWKTSLPPDFEIIDPGDAAHAVLPPSTSTTFRVTYDPSQIGGDVAFLLFKQIYNAETTQVTVQGNGVESIIRVTPSNLAFGPRLVGTSVTETIRIENLGVGELVISSATFDPTSSAFSLNHHQFSITILNGDYEDIDVTYTPIEYVQGSPDPDPNSAEMTLHTNNPSNPEYKVNLTGTPVWPACEFSVVQDPNFIDAIDFGETNLGTTKTRHLVISNAGGWPCEVHSLAFSPSTSSAFTFSHPGFLEPIQPGLSRIVTINYSPNYPSPDEGDLIIQTNDLRAGHSYFEIELNGKGVNPTIFVTPPSSYAQPCDFGDILKNACSEEKTFAIRNYGVGTLEVDTDFEPTGMQQAWRLANISNSPLGNGLLRNYDDPSHPGDEITFTLQFCPLGITGFRHKTEIDISSNDTDRPTKTVYCMGQGVECPDGWYDNDDDPTDCEYPCLTPPEDLFPIEKCDTYDNDCNGTIDEGFSLGSDCSGMGECGDGVLECDPYDDYRTICSTMPNGSTDESSHEKCDLLDNDCDGEKDEDFGTNDPCIGVGECGIGVIECDSNYTTKCSSDVDGSQYAGSPEICNGDDDDCDGFTDNGIFWIEGSAPLLDCENCIDVVCMGSGACGWGVYECARDLGDDWIRCCSNFGGSCMDAETEYCDGADNNCDGLTDEGFSVGVACTGIGRCSEITGARQCDPTNNLTTICSSDIGGDDYPNWQETCNSLDDDCDGETDEDFNIGDPCLGTGECKNFDGSWECNPLHGLPDFPGEPITICSTDPNGSEHKNIPELCDNLDNDCDGETDEDFFVGQICVGIGECGLGTRECETVSRTVCSTDPEGSERQDENETCDGNDNDCDGQTDEDFLVGQICDGVGECGAGTNVCSGLHDYICSTDPGGPDNEATLEQCDGLDNDCDNLTDEDYFFGQLCIGIGECGEGTWECAGLDERRCSTDDGGTEDQSFPEICDGKDNDCDGLVDEDFDFCDDDMSINFCGGCGTVCTVLHGTPECAHLDAGGCGCAIETCDTGWHDTDGLYSSGCECQNDSNDLAGFGNSCVNAVQADPYILTDNSSGRATMNGRLAELEDEDWYTFNAKDGGETGPNYCDEFYVSIQFASNPTGEVAFDVYRDNCASLSCTGDTDYVVATDSTWPPDGGEDNAWGKGQCPCKPAASSPDGEANTAPVTFEFNHCETEDIIFFVRVYRIGTPGQNPTCGDYELEVSNGFYSTN